MTTAAGTGTGMEYEGLLPWRLEPAAALPSAVQLAAFNDSNEILLANVLMLDEKTDYGEHDEVMTELRRQDQKLRLVLDLLGTLLQQHSLVPPAQTVRFTGEQIAVPAGIAPAVETGSLVKCSLYLDASMAKPLTLHASSMAGESAHGGVVWKCFGFVGLSANVTDQLEKFIFRQHRRAVALQRRH